MISARIFKLVCDQGVHAPTGRALVCVVVLQHRLAAFGAQKIGVSISQQRAVHDDHGVSVKLARCTTMCFLVAPS